MYFVSDGTANTLGVPTKHNTLKQAKKDLTLRLRAQEPFCRKHEKTTLTVLHQAISAVDALNENTFMDVPARAWVISIGGITRHFRIEVHYG
jgi:hypothetical protein